MRVVALSLGVRNKDKEASAQESGVVCCLFALSYRRTSTKMEKELLKENISCRLDLRNEKIGYKIREHSNTKIPIIFVIGEKEEKSKTIAVRRLGSNEIENTTLQSMIDFIKDEKSKY